jgi:hypothetical protein
MRSKMMRPTYWKIKTVTMKRMRDLRDDQDSQADLHRDT